MTLKIIDVASHQHENSAYAARMNAAWPAVDGIIIKATQGVGYVNRYCDGDYQRAKRDGKLRGVYHYAGGNDPVAEADFFIANIAGYIKDAMLILDWEEAQNAAWGNTNWCRRFVDRVHEKIGVWPVIYVQASAIGQCANCAADCGLWVAGYPARDLTNTWEPGPLPYGIAPWKAATGWQYTEGAGCDRNIFYVDRGGWDRIANPNGTTASKPATTKPAPAPAFDVEKAARDVIAGKYGDGQTRRNRLGANYDRVQKRVNEILGATQPARRTYVVQSGDTLSGIAARYGTTYIELARRNGIANPNIIYPGQTIRID